MSGRSPVDALVRRIDGLRAVVEATRAYLPAERLAPAEAVIRRAGQRLALSRGHTVVALAGATGSGKSSLFNALAGTPLSAVGVRRPTTGQAHAAAWGPEPARELLDWLGVGARHGLPDDDGLGGLVLLDLPDIDSVRSAHRVEADRLLALVDLIVWVLDPQKYADQVLHRRYLGQYGHHRDITVVALNQADRLDAAGRRACLHDLARLLAADGLAGVAVLATSTAGEPGVDELRGVVRQAVAGRRAALQRLSADVNAVAAGLRPLVAPARTTGQDRSLAGDLTRALAGAAGVPVVARATERAYVHRAVRHTGWPVTRWLRRLRPDPLRRLRLGGTAGTGPGAPGAAGGPRGAVSGAGGGAGEPTAVTSIGPAAPAATAAVGLALRAVGERSGHGLPDPWPAAMLDAARSRQADLPDALDLAVARTDLGMARTPGWWRLVGTAQWLLLAAGSLGVAWLVLRYALFALALPEPPSPQVGRVPLFTLLFTGGILGGLVLAAVARPAVSAAARRRGRRAADRLTAAVRDVGAELVLAPVAVVGRHYDEARRALDDGD